MSKIGLIPAAGYARRLENLVGSKEMIPINGEYGIEPVCHSLIRQFANAGIKEVLLITRPDKIDLIEHINHSLDIDISVKIVLINNTSSTFESICLAYDYIVGKEVYLGFPDMMLTPPNAMEKLLSQMNHTEAKVVLGAFLSDIPEKVDMVDFDDEGNLKNIIIKDATCTYKYAWILAGWKKDFSDYLYHQYNKRQHQQAGCELYIGQLIREYLLAGNKVGVQTINNGSFIDIGTPEDLHFMQQNQ